MRREHREHAELGGGEAARPGGRLPRRGEVLAQLGDLADECAERGPAPEQLLELGHGAALQEHVPVRASGLLLDLVLLDRESGGVEQHAGLTGSRAGEQLKTALLATARNAGVTPQTVIRVELSGELNLQRAGIDLAELAGFLEKELPVCAAELSMGTSDLSVGIGSGLELPGTGETREAIERQAIMDILAAGPPEFVEPQQLPDLTELFMQLKEAVRREEPAEEIVDRLARHSVVQALARKYTAIREEAAAPGNAAVAVGKESSNDCTPDQAKEY